MKNEEPVFPWSRADFRNHVLRLVCEYVPAIMEELHTIADRSDLVLSPRALVPARECGVVRGLEVEAHQAEQRVQEPLGLAERQAEDDSQRQRGPDREVRVPPLASAKTVLRWYPRGNCILAQPDRDVAAAPEATLVLPPVPDSVLRLVLAVDSARLRCNPRSL